jgi:nucleotide-binding universal stress UspA family protein
MIEHILVPLDTSPLAECVLPHAIALAHSFGADITLLHIVQSPHSATESNYVDPIAWDMQKTEARHYLEDVVSRLRQVDVPAEALLLEGQPEECIVQSAQGYEETCLVLSSHAQGGLSEWKIGSVTQRIMSRRHVTTMIVRACEPVDPDLHGSRYHRLLVPMDGSLRAECVLPLVTMLSNFHQAHVILAHVITAPEMPHGILTPPEDLELAHRLVEHMRIDALDYLVETRTKAGSDTEIRLLESNNLAEALHKLINEEQIDLVVMSAHGHSGRADWPYGSLVTNFITNCTTSLLIVQDLPEKPESIRQEFSHRDLQTVRRLKDRT